MMMKPAQDVAFVRSASAGQSELGPSLHGHYRQPGVDARVAADKSRYKRRKFRQVYSLSPIYGLFKAFI